MLNPIRVLARQMLASQFVFGGLDAIANPVERAELARDVTQPLAERVPAVRALNTPTLVQLNGAVQVVGGIALALGKLPRVASAALAASLVPTTLAGHRFWEETDPRARSDQQAHFFKNLSMLGGLVLSVLDTEGEPGVAWRAQHAVEHAGIHARHARREAATRAELAREKLTPDVMDAKRLVSAVRG